MKKSIMMLCIGILATSIATAEDALTFLHGSWAGPGTTSGIAGTIRHTWGPALNGQFTILRLHNRMILEDGSEMVFAGNGYYRTSDDTSPTGVWIDSNGEILPLQITIEGHSMVVVWGNSETKLGRSVYRLLEDGALETSDFIANDQGEWKKFGHAVLQRAPSDEE